MLVGVVVFCLFYLVGPVFGHPFGYACFLKVFIHFDSQSAMDETDFLNQKSWPGISQFGTFWVFLRVNRGVFLPSSSIPWNSFFILFIHSVVLSRSLRSHIFLQNVLLPFRSIAYMSSCNLPVLTSRIFFVVFECLVLFLLFDPVSVSF